MSRDNWARMPLDYHDDPELAFIHDTIEDEHQSGYLVWLYWPTIVTLAKGAKSFGWFRCTLRSVATKVGDKPGERWDARLRMWSMLAAADRVRIRQGSIESPFDQIDVLHVDYEDLQSLSNREHSKLRREREKVSAGHPAHWTVRHWSEFAFTPVDATSVDDSEIVSVDLNAAQEATPHSANRQTIRVADTGTPSTNDYETRLNETKEGARGRALPPTVIETLGLVRSIPGLSAWQLESNVLKAMQQFPSLPDAAICEAITAFEAKIPEGQTIRSEKAWRLMHACFRVAGQKATEQQASVSSLDPDARLAAMRADMAANRHLLDQSGAA